jgi:hypothetical protein
MRVEMEGMRNRWEIVIPGMVGEEAVLIDQRI